MKLHELTIFQAHELLHKREISSKELTTAVLNRIEAVDPKVGAYLTLNADEAMEQAEAADRWLASDDASGPLTGVPIALKDILVTKGLRTTAGSRILEGFIPPYDGTVVAKLRAAGAVFVGKTNLDEFAMGSSNENSAYGPVRNPWDLTRVPGGSSGGSAAAVAADECMGAIGTDTGGSIRLPASYCGIVGLKPTYGRVSRYGVIAYASSLDQVGPMTKDVRDAAILLGAIAGHDRMDSTSLRDPVPDYLHALKGQVRGLRVGLPREYFAEGLDPEVERIVRAAIETLESLGAEVREIALPHAGHAVATYYIVATAEASSNLARYDGVRYGRRAPGVRDVADMFFESRAQGFGDEVKRRIMLGTFVLSSGYYDAYYGRAQKARSLIRRDFDEAFGQVDVIVGPAAPAPAFKLGEKTADPLTMYLTDIYTIATNLAGIAGLSVPAGFTEAGLPVGLQILARPLGEPDLLRAAHALEQALGLTARRAEL
ncbi:MAG: Asp-tRNA(Asn)/Glu-tRNA(Gln) amidotransferase subunit GatA [Myxococcales bacterium]|nr:Asp-tRNA(Asn)/Glu-tRNA(Gln) amidotransferase subunit GatA [Myxococcales bacterium]